MVSGIIKVWILPMLPIWINKMCIYRFSEFCEDFENVKCNLKW